ncbi:UDP-N-acetylmuramoyl-L-alanyl-D-glutamate--2,6-diaminopimelate ligase [Desulfoluna butyratoxydans]|uniref:UDP-N-acetylmuramoyl-L-alanyl-D-glutamate--2,6-diaminopimelate ligase n=1 Tax=Desulfoluna butyratoxydans TaxID=231438 RepID=A0A4U8YH27_9BACT|nr:UDP-N-acetylmuramoyl-L-alanyl-D-glutamate--2,6-diaminopimelate ligase [Desulfoluna butyratoxydans]VFQ42444.1 udp-n-acetylmuramoylalanyl-d-glutamate-2 6-diaminopimelate ligase [Desulfoluna butyratoxydans]
MTLSCLTHNIGDLLAAPLPEADPLVSAVQYDSRKVTEGALFVAVPGEAVDGHRYIPEAIERGAVAVLGELPHDDLSVPYIQVTDSRKALALISATFYENPADRLTLVAVTGTNGKTTVAYIMESIFAAAGHSAGVMGTISTRFCGKEETSTMTTPESRDIQDTLARMADAGVTHAVMEVSSHALALDRVAGCAFDAAIFTNLTQDHLDYHGTMEIYGEAKRQLFEGHRKKGGAAVINMANEHGRHLTETLTGTVFPVGGDTGALTADHIEVAIDGIKGEFVTPEGRTPFASGATGRYNLENILCAAGAALSVGIPMDAVVRGVAAFKVPGRLERVDTTCGRHLFVDYAHTPDALENVLSTLRHLVPGRLICVLGCGGDRDRTKRPLMAGIGAAYSDLAVLTSDNPRSEAPEKIIEDMVPGIDGETSFRYEPERLSKDFSRKGYVVVVDRREAIGLAVASARPGDTVLVAGKGHETYQIIGDRRLDFDDRKEVLKAVEDRR